MDTSYYKQFEPIDGKWYITKELGRGAFGTVFEVERHDFSHMKAAMKVVSIPNAPGEIQSYRAENYDLDDKSVTSYFFGFVEEFIKEFQLMSQLKGHSNIVSYEDHNVVERTGEIGWDIFIRMELLTPMSDHFKQATPTRADVIKLGIDICKALEVCRSYQIIHRDIKPSNIFVSASGDFKLGDFGVARTLEKTSGGLSKKGTYTYMAPEVFKGEAYDATVDIYSLGIVMYRLLNNNMEPFRKDRTYGDGEKAMEMRITGKPIPAPACADSSLSEVILKACSYEPGDRFENPTRMREALERLQKTENEENKPCPEEKPSMNASPQPVQADEIDEGTVGLFGDHRESRAGMPQASVPPVIPPRPNVPQNNMSQPVAPQVNMTAEESDYDRTQSLFGSRETTAVQTPVNPAVQQRAVHPAPKAVPKPVPQEVRQTAPKTASQKSSGRISFVVKMAGFALLLLVAFANLGMVLLFKSAAVGALSALVTLANSFGLLLAGIGFIISGKKRKPDLFIGIFLILYTVLLIGNGFVGVIIATVNGPQILYVLYRLAGFLLALQPYVIALGIDAFMRKKAPIGLAMIAAFLFGGLFSLFLGPYSTAFFPVGCIIISMIYCFLVRNE